MMAVRGLVAAAERAGVEPSRFLAKVGLGPIALDDVCARLSLADYRRVLSAALATSGDPALGLHMGERAGVGAFDVLGHLSEHSRSLRDALSTAMRYASIVTDGPKLELEELAETATLRLSFGSGDSPEARFGAEFSLVALLRLIRRFIGPGAEVERVCFSYAAPAHRAEYARVFTGRERFAQDFTGMEFPRQWLDQSPHYPSRELYELLQTRAEQLLAKVEQQAPIAERVKRWLVAQNVSERPTMESIARALGMSARSLRRRLHLENVHFGPLVEQALAVRAKRMLEDPRCSVQEIAYAMGFQTPSAFSRAFKRWTGTAPSAFRATR